MDDPPHRLLQPIQTAFMIPRCVPALIGGVVLGALAGVGLLVADLGPAVAALGGVGVLAAVVGFGVYAALIAFRKERYELYPNHLRCHHGGLVSDELTELDVRNITHVKLRLPWIRHKLFGVGDVFVESAGSGGSEVALNSIQDPERVYDEIQQLMQRNGYSLARGEVLHEERPDLIGVVVECIGLAFGVIMGIVIFVAEVVLDEGIDPNQAVDAAGQLNGLLAVVFTVIGGLVLLGGLFSLIVHFLDLRRRTYRVFDDVVVYEEGFLTRDNAFIPFENIADANTKRTFVDQILGLYDVQVSCQGSGSEIKFRRLRRGDALTRAIGRLVEASSARPKPSSERVGAQPDGAPGLELPEAPGAIAMVPPDQAWTATLRPDLVRALVGTLPAGLFVIPAVAALIHALATSYRVRGSSVQSAYNFLNTNEREFAYDKITGVVISTSPWDRLFGTCTVRFWSIGASMPLDLAHVKRAQLNLKALLRQAGIPSTESAPYEVPARFGPLAWIQGRLPLAVFVGLLGLGIGLAGALIETALFALAIPLGLALVAWLLYQSALYSRQRLRFFPGHVEGEVGVLWRSSYYARYDNIKKVKVTRYPGGDLGSVQLFVAGEMRVAANQKGGQGDQQSGGATIPYSFTAAFLDGVEGQRRLIDDFLLGRVAVAPGAQPAEPLPVLREGQPALGNALTRVILFSVVTVVFMPLLLLTVPWTIVAVRRRSYRVEGGRVLALRGVLYTSQSSILFTRIDSLKQGQGPLNKLFGNGAVTLLTAGSSSPDLVLADLPGHKDFYEAIRPHYGRT